MKDSKFFKIFIDIACFINLFELIPIKKLKSSYVIDQSMISISDMKKIFGGESNKNS